MSEKRGRITKRTVDALKPGQITWDTDVKGFGARCQRSAKVYVLKTRVNGRQRWLSIGRHGSPWTVETARREAQRLLGAVAGGKDPASTRDAAKEIPTLSILAGMFLREHAEAKRKASTAKGYRDYFDRLILPELGQVRVADITRADIARLHHSLKQTPYQANRVLAVLSKAFSWAEQHGYRPEGANLCRNVEKYRENKREKFLSEEELGRLGDTLSAIEREDSESPFVIAAIRLLIFTGARRNEILEMRWENVDFDRAVLRLLDSKTGAKHIFLSAPALEVLSQLPRLEGNPHVICGHKVGSRLINLRKPWQRVLARAGLGTVRLHDLRHSFASVGVAGGLSMPMMGKLLGHTKIATTERYAHLAADPIRAANEAIGERIAAVMKGRNNLAEVVDLTRGDHGKIA